jgi:uncharacterized RDD family membrane protein YckC
MHDVRPAGFWIRAAAAAIDAVVLAFVDLSLGLVARKVWGETVEESAVLHGAVVLFTLIFAALYVTLLHAAAGQTIGKMLVRAHVVLVDGAAVPVGTSLLRFLACFASAAPLGMGFVMAGLRRDKRALHDLLAGTRVERRLPAPPPAPTEPVATTEPTEAATPPVA